MKPVNNGRFFGSAMKAMIVNAPEPIPADPRPAIARPAMLFGCQNQSGLGIQIKGSSCMNGLTGLWN